jgi:hypothetical protein
MKYLVLILAAFGLAACNSSGDSVPAVVQQGCTKLQTMAELTMQRRQNGTPMQEMLDANNTGDPSFQQFTEQMIRGAYDQPQVSGPGNISMVATQYGNEEYKRCVKVITKLRAGGGA